MSGSGPPDPNRDPNRYPNRDSDRASDRDADRDPNRDTDSDPDPDPDRELRVSKIRNGTVIDHITGGQALNVLAILGIDGGGGETVSVAMNVPSDRLGGKDVLKVEGRELSQDEVDVLSLIAPAATINIIREYEVVDKHRVSRPDRVVGVLSCPNANCITTEEEPVASRFAVLEDGVRCTYCDTIIRENIADHIGVD